MDAPVGEVGTLSFRALHLLSLLFLLPCAPVAFSPLHPGFLSVGTSASARLLSVGGAAVWLSAAFLPGPMRCTHLFQELQDFCPSCIQIQRVS